MSMDPGLSRRTILKLMAGGGIGVGLLSNHFSGTNARAAVGAIDGEWTQYRRGPRNTAAVSVDTPSKNVQTRWTASGGRPLVVDDDLFLATHDAIFRASFGTGEPTGDALLSFDAATLSATYAVADGKLLVGSKADGGDVPPVYLTAVDLESGDQEWQYTVDGEDPYTGIRINKPPNPTVGDGTAYFVGGVANGAYVHAVDVTTGEQEWGFTPDEGPYYSDTGVIGVADPDPPAVADGSVFAKITKRDSEGGIEYSKLYALDADSGYERWSMESDATFVSYAANAPVVADGNVYILDNVGDGVVHAVDTESGRINWQYAGPERTTESATRTCETETTREDDDRWSATPTTTPTATRSPDDSDATGYGIDAPGTTLAADDNSLYVATVALRPDERTATTRTCLSDAQTTTTPTTTPAGSPDFERRPQVVAFDHDGRRRWTTTLAAEPSQAIVVAADLVYVGTEDGYLVGLDVDSGEVRVRYDVSDGRIRSQALVRGGVFVDHDGGVSHLVGDMERPNAAPTIESIRVSPESGDTLTSFSFSVDSTDVDDSVESVEWDLDGDGESEATGESVTYSYDDPGEYEVSVSVTDETGATRTRRRSVVVDAPDETTPTATARESTTEARTDSVESTSPTGTDESTETVAPEDVLGEGGGDDSGDGADEDGDDDSSDSGTPGFGVAEGVAALSAGAALLRRAGGTDDAD